MWPGQAVEDLLVEDLVDEAELRVDEEALAVADRDAGRLLAAVLEGVEAEVGELGDVLAGRVYAEDAARFARLVEESIARVGRSGRLQAPPDGRTACSLGASPRR